jgi:hypothetical protein
VDEAGDRWREAFGEAGARMVEEVVAQVVAGVVRPVDRQACGFQRCTHLVERQRRGIGVGERADGPGLRHMAGIVGQRSDGIAGEPLEHEAAGLAGQAEMDGDVGPHLGAQPRQRLGQGRILDVEHGEPDVAD